MVFGPIDRRAVILQDLRRPVALAPVVKSVPHNGQEPGPGGAIAKRSDILERAHAGVLDHVLGVVDVAGQPARKVVAGIQMRQDQLFETDVPGQLKLDSLLTIGAAIYSCRTRGLLLVHMHDAGHERMHGADITEVALLGKHMLELVVGIQTFRGEALVIAGYRVRRFVCVGPDDLGAWRDRDFIRPILELCDLDLGGRRGAGSRCENRRHGQGCAKCQRGHGTGATPKGGVAKSVVHGSVLVSRRRAVCRSTRADGFRARGSAGACRGACRAPRPEPLPDRARRCLPDPAWATGRRATWPCAERCSLRLSAAPGGYVRSAR